MLKILGFNKWIIKVLLVSFLTIPNSLNAQRNSFTIPGADWEVYLSDSLLFKGNLDLRYALRPKAIIDMRNVKDVNLTIIFRGYRSHRSYAEFRLKDSVLFRAAGYGDWISITSRYYSKELKLLEGKTAEIFYFDDKYQKTPTLLGTLIFKKE